MAERRMVVRKIADLLRAGAALLPEHCPICKSPLLRLRSGEVVCPIHGRVFIVRDEAEYARAELQGVLEELERGIVRRLHGYAQLINKGGEVDRETLHDIILWLEAVERIERILKSRTAPPAGQGEREEARKRGGR
ncbi:MAG: hypothetical protein GXO09_05395 [Crenarchaeota archaeon]|nr:hypothetical protein [Thermoproteota archaeon]